MNVYEIIRFIFLITLLEGLIMSGTNIEDFNFFNPIRNYEKWYRMNWFGIMLFTLLLNIILPVYAFGYWFYQLCTVGRK